MRVGTDQRVPPASVTAGLGMPGSGCVALCDAGNPIFQSAPRTREARIGEISPA